MAEGRREQIKNILNDLGTGFSADYQLGREDRRNAFLRDRKLKGQTESPQVGRNDGYTLPRSGYRSTWQAEF